MTAKVYIHCYTAERKLVLKKIWIFNHHASTMFMEEGGRHYNFAKYLAKNGYEPTVFCASLPGEQKSKAPYTRLEKNGVTFVYLYVPHSSQNGMKRIAGMFYFYRSVLSATKAYAKKYGQPDIVLGSSVHPLSMVAGIKVAARYKVPCISEVRDLWPESLVAYGYLRKDSLFAKLLYAGEKWIYKKSDAVIMTWEGGKDYIIDRGWDTAMDVSKVRHICNGVDIDAFDANMRAHTLDDPDLQNPSVRRIVYTGAIRQVNKIGELLDAAKILKERGVEDILFLLYGDGNEVPMLQKKAEEEHINNVRFKGRVERQYIPYILSRAYINVLQYESTILNRWGQSQNKLFEYMASGKIVLQTYSCDYSIIERYQCGVCLQEQSAEEIANAIESLCLLNEDEQKALSENARKAACAYDYKRLTEKLIDIVEELTRKSAVGQ